MVTKTISNKTTGTKGKTGASKFTNKKAKKTVSPQAMYKFPPDPRNDAAWAKLHGTSTRKSIGELLSELESCLAELCCEIGTDAIRWHPVAVAFVTNWTFPGWYQRATHNKKNVPTDVQLVGYAIEVVDCICNHLGNGSDSKFDHIPGVAALLAEHGDIDSWHDEMTDLRESLTDLEDKLNSGECDSGDGRE